MSNTKLSILLAILFVLFAVVGTMDYNDQVKHDAQHAAR